MQSKTKKHQLRQPSLVNNKTNRTGLYSIFFFLLLLCSFITDVKIFLLAFQSLNSPFLRSVFRYAFSIYMHICMYACSPFRSSAADLLFFPRTWTKSHRESPLIHCGQFFLEPSAEDLRDSTSVVIYKRYPKARLCSLVFTSGAVSSFVAIVLHHRFSYIPLCLSIYWPLWNITPCSTLGSMFHEF